MKHNREEYNRHIQALIKMMQDDYPNDFILEINSFGAEIHSTLTTMVFTDETLDLKEKVNNLFGVKTKICDRCIHYKESRNNMVCICNGVDTSFIPPDILTECPKFTQKE